MQTEGWPLGRPPGFEEQGSDPDIIEGIQVGSVRTYQSQLAYFDDSGHTHYDDPHHVQVLVVVPQHLCPGVQSYICKSIEGSGTRLCKMAEWVAEAGRLSGLDPQERVILSYEHDLQ